MEPGKISVSHSKKHIIVIVLAGNLRKLFGGRSRGEVRQTVETLGHKSASLTGCIYSNETTQGVQ